MKTKTNKAQGMSINIVIILVIALLTLAVVGYFFIGGFESSGGAISETAEGATGGLDTDGLTKDLGNIGKIWERCDDGFEWDYSKRKCVLEEAA